MVSDTDISILMVSETTAEECFLPRHEMNIASTALSYKDQAAEVSLPPKLRTWYNTYMYKLRAHNVCASKLTIIKSAQGL